MKKASTLVVAAAMLGLAAGAAAQPAAEKDPLLAEVEGLLKAARDEIAQFERSGKRTDPAHPVSAAVEKLWAFRERHPPSSAAGKATAEAIHLLVHADRVPEAEARADRLSPDDRAWDFLAPILFEAAAAKKDYAFLVAKLDAAAKLQGDPKLRAPIHYNLGRGHAKAGNAEAARAALKAAIQEAAGAPVAKEAENALYELDNLGYGQPAPAFTATARDGSRVALADFRGRVVLLVFWAST